MENYVKIKNFPLMNLMEKNVLKLKMNVILKMIIKVKYLIMNVILMDVL